MVAGALLLLGGWKRKMGCECGREYPDPFWVVSRRLGLAQRVGWGGWSMSQPPLCPKVLTVFFLQEAGSTCSSSVSDVISDSEELLLESLPSSEDEPPSCPSGTFFFFFIFFFLPSSSLCSLEKRGQTGLGSSLDGPFMPHRRAGKTLKTGGEGGEPGPQHTTPGLQ